MSSQEDAKKIELTELIDMCNQKPASVSLSGRAQNDAYNDFGLESATEVKTFIGGNNLEDPIFDGCRESEQIKGTYITAYTFKSGTKHGYLAYHRKQTDSSKVHIKSFHKNKMHPEHKIASLADFFPTTLSGGKSEKK